MKKILLIVVVTLISVATWSQNGVIDNEKIRSCCYEKAYLKSDNTGTIEFSNFEITYNKQDKTYEIHIYVIEGTQFDFVFKYDRTLRDRNDFLYVYKGYRECFKENSVILTRTKLSEYAKNGGFNSREAIMDWDKQTIMFTLLESFTVFSVAPIKNNDL